jgi:hypothetical protein
MLEIDPFLTAYDPSDLPGASMDPLGFERGYLLLAEKILPALTNVAAVPRYFSMLCAGTSLAAVEPTAPVRKQREARRETVMRLERLWVLANYLAARKNESWSLNGLRGLRYVAAEAARLDQSGETAADPDYKLLSRQAPYGVLGIYGAVAEELRFFADRDAMVLSPDAGVRLAEAFREETSLPASVRKAVLGEGSVSIAALAKWGEAAYLAGPHGAEESACLGDALDRDPVRARMCQRLAERPFKANETELDRLNRIAVALDPTGPDADLRETIDVIIAYESAYAWALLAFERLLWLCREATTPVSDSSRAGDRILKRIAEALPGVVSTLEAALHRVRTPHLGANPEPLVDVRQFLVRMAAAVPNVSDVSDVLLSRHADVQHGKFDRGRRKLPWLERTPDGIVLTMTRVGGLDREVTSPADIRPHFYRLAAADAFTSARSAS